MIYMYLIELTTNFIDGLFYNEDKDFFGTEEDATIFFDLEKAKKISDKLSSWDNRNEADDMLLRVINFETEEIVYNAVPENCSYDEGDYNNCDDEIERYNDAFGGGGNNYYYH